MKRVLKVLDLETTGFLPEDRVVEIGCTDLEIGENIWVGRRYERLVNPGIPIPPQVSAVHHIIDEDVATAVSFQDALDYCLCPEVGKETIGLVAHNARFEKQWIKSDLPWICTWKAAIRAWPDAPSHSNQVLRYWLAQQGKMRGVLRSMCDPAHRASPDTYVTAHILRTLLDHFTVEQMFEMEKSPALLPRVKFGKHQDKTWTEVPKDYLRWVLDPKQKFDEDVVYTARYHLGLETGARLAT